MTSTRAQICERLLLDDKFLDVLLHLTPDALQALVGRLHRGALVDKFGRRASRAQRRSLFLSPDRDGVGYASSTKRAEECIMLLRDVDTILSGQHTAVFVAARAGRHCSPAAAARCLSIVCAPGAPRHTLDVCFDSEEEAHAWRTGLSALLHAARAGAEDSDTRFLRRAFAAAADGGRVLPIARVPSLLPTGLGLLVPRWGGGGGGGDARLEELLAEAAQRERAAAAAAGGSPGSGDSSGEAPAAPSISLAGVLRVVDALRAEGRADVARLFEALLAEQRGGGEAATPLHPLPLPGGQGGGCVAAAAHHPPSGLLFAPALLAFLQRQQGQAGAGLEDAARLCAYWDGCHPGEGAMCLPSFAAWLTSSSNSAFSPAASARGWCDLNAPLSHYWIEASHNTYLEGTQLTGTSSVAPYLAALAKGCRCVELDCWDGGGGGNGEAAGAAAEQGRDGGDSGEGSGGRGAEGVGGGAAEPVIYHGHTLTSHVPFRAVVEALARFAFCAAGEASLPLILSLEVHCSPPMQDVMAAILVGAFGDRLLRAPSAAAMQECGGQLPSPHSLRGRVLVKAKLKEGESGVGFRGLGEAGNSSSIGSGGGGGGGGGGASASPIFGATSLRPLLPPRSSGSARFSEALASIVYLRGVAWKDMKAALPVLAESGSGLPPQAPTLPLLAPSPWCVSSLKESKMLDALRSGPGRMQAFTRTHLLRVYPGPLRFTSSNFNPCAFWASGVQMTALNYQTLDVPMRLQRAWFQQNGRCGYVLKPSYLTGGEGGAEEKGGCGGAASAAAPPTPAPLSSPPCTPRGEDSGEGGGGLGAGETPTSQQLLVRLKQWLRSLDLGSTPPGVASCDEALLLPREPRGVPTSAALPPSVTLRVEPLGAANLPLREQRPRASALTWSFSVHGAPGDSCRHPRTRTLGAAHGLCAWEESGDPLAWVLAAPHVATLYVEVHEGGAFLAYAALPVCAMRWGYRACQLRGANGKKLPLCTLLARFSIA